eukprot:gene18537-20398_t
MILWTSEDLWMRDLATYQPAERETGRYPKSMEGAIVNVTRKDKIRKEDLRSRSKVKDDIQKATETKDHRTGYLAQMGMNNG